jgi:aminoglycoside phosphotransferase (APT) family kinase protein
MPVAEVHVDAPLVRRLLHEQYPSGADLPVVEAARGWDNAMFRLGDDLGVRLPLRAVAASLVGHEARWLPELAPRLPPGVGAPVPVFRGAPGVGYPWPWTVVPWFEGRALATLPVGERTAYAEQLADALVALHHPAPREEAPVNPWRGVALGDRLRHVPAELDVARRALGPEAAVVLAEAWADGLAGPRWPGRPVWLHGDPHPLNVLVSGGRLRALLDWGDVTAGDPASDLATAWLSFDRNGRTAFRRRVEATGSVDPAVWRRAAGWAAALTLALLSHHGPGEALHDVAVHTVRQLARGA